MIWDSIASDFRLGFPYGLSRRRENLRWLEIESGPGLGEFQAEAVQVCERRTRSPQSLRGSLDGQRVRRSLEGEPCAQIWTLDLLVSTNHGCSGSMPAWSGPRQGLARRRVEGDERPPGIRSDPWPPCPSRQRHMPPRSSCNSPRHNHPPHVLRQQRQQGPSQASPTEYSSLLCSSEDAVQNAPILRRSKAGTFGPGLVTGYGSLKRAGRNGMRTQYRETPANAAMLS